MSFIGVKLRPFEQGDMELIRSWRNMQRVKAGSYTQRTSSKPISKEEHEQWFATRGPWWKFIVVQASLDNEIFKDVGLVTLGCLDNAYPELGYYIGKPEYEGKGIMHQALLLVIRWLQKHGYTHVRTVVLTDNKASQALMWKLGFICLCQGRPGEDFCMKTIGREWKATEYTSGRKPFLPIDTMASYESR